VERVGKDAATAVTLPSAIEHWPVERLKPYDQNPRTHSRSQIKKIARSMREFGFTNPILVDGDAGIIAGHGRLEAAKLLGLGSVPVIELSHLSAQQKRAYVLADNRLALDAGWDEDLLGQELLALQNDDFDLDLTGFDDSELASLLGQTEPEEVPVPEPPAVPVSRTGDLWLLGSHRLLCGDATNAADVVRVLGGAAPRLLVTDAPYGVELDMEWRDRAGHNTLGAAEPSYLRTPGHRNTTISGDNKADWSDAFELVPSLDTAYVWHASTRAGEVGEGLRRIGFELKQQLIWRKTRFVLSRTHYHWQHEPCWYARKPGAAPFRGPRDQSTVWEAASPKMIMSAHAPGDEAVDHPTQKPVALFTRPIENNTKRGEWVYEAFAGSGTTLIAAEQTGRRCIAIEIDPKYVDVVVERWALATKKHATLDGDGRTFEAVREARAQEATNAGA